MHERMRFGIIGAGCIGALRGRALQRVAGGELAGITDIDIPRAKKIARQLGTKIFASAAELVCSDEIDAVIVSTPPQFHEEAVSAAFAGGKHVLCEKPLCSSLDGCARMIRAADEAGKKLATGFNHRYFPAIQFLTQTLGDGTIGKLNHVRAFAGHEGLSQFRAPWEYDSAVIGGGALMDVGIHMIDLVAYVLGDVREVSGIATGEVWNLKGGEDNGFALLRSSAGVVATLHATWTEWKGYRFSIEAYGDRGMVRAYYAPMRNTLITKATQHGKPKRRFIFYPGNIVKEKVFGWQSTVVETFRKELEDFERLCRGDGYGRIADGDAGFRAVEIAKAIYRSSAEARTVSLVGPLRLAPKPPGDR